MASSEKRLVTLHGGHSDGEMVYVHPARLQIVETYDRGSREYAKGEWGENSARLVTNLVGWEEYRRVDAENFEAVAA